MKAIIIQDHDASNLLDLLELSRFEQDQQKYGEFDLDKVHRKFHFIVCRWLQEQGASVVR